MSHIVKVKTKLRTGPALAAAVAKLGGTAPAQGTFNLYAGATATGAGFKLPGWRYPIVLKEDGELAFDNYGGAWGNPKDLDLLKQHYGAAVAIQNLTKQGFRLTGPPVIGADGKLRLEVAR